MSARRRGRGIVSLGTPSRSIVLARASGYRSGPGEGSRPTEGKGARTSTHARRPHIDRTGHCYEDPNVVPYTSLNTSRTSADGFNATFSIVTVSDPRPGWSYVGRWSCSIPAPVTELRLDVCDAAAAQSTCASFGPGKNNGG